MFLKTLTLKGFKSFADSTTLSMEPGVTVVVGPNGSGKSNVVDAIGWVLGAQAPSAVRSGKMDDVIFAGTSKRAALGRAEVSLTIDNSSGLLPIEFTEVTITRTLFRTGDSEYALNGVPCRLLDVQELLSDTGMGRQQHVIISQGQIDAVLNARPEERRLIIEEAAGVLKYRRRKEKAERRLAATEANLTRLEDLLREVRRQLRPLEKQADAARRHQGLVDELRALRIHLSGRDLQRLRDRLTSNETTAGELARAERDVRSRLAALDAELVAAEAALMAAGGSELSERLGRCESLRERARGQRALIAERRRRIESERRTDMDQTVVASLEAEAAQLAESLAEVENESDALEPVGLELSDAETELALARENFATRFGDAAPSPGHRAAEMRGEIAAFAEARERNTAEVARLSARQSTLAEKLLRLQDELGVLEATARDTSVALDDLRTAAEQAETAATKANDASEAADTTRREADAELAAWSARVETLESALDAARARAGVERLSGLDGVVGTLLDVVTVDEGYEPAFEAAVGEAVAAVVVDGVAGARAALDQLRHGKLDGAVLALGQPRLPPRHSIGSHPGAGQLREHVHSTRPGVDELLERLVGDVAVTATVDEAIEIVLAHCDATVVTLGGDRFSPSGWRLSTSGSGATGGALANAKDQVEVASRNAAVARARAQDAKTAFLSAQDAMRAAQTSLDRTIERQSATRIRIDRVTTDLADTMTEADGIAELRVRLEEAGSQEAERSEAMAAELVELEAAERAALELAEQRDHARRAIEAETAQVATMRANLQVQTAALAQRRELLERRTREVEDRLALDARRRAEAGERRAGHERIVRALFKLDAIVTDRLGELDLALGELREQRRVQSEAERVRSQKLEELRTQRGAAENELDSVRDRAQQLGLGSAELRVRIEQVTEALRGELDVDPQTAMSAPCPELPDTMTPIARVRDLERELRAMGTINPLATAEFEAMSERHEFLSSQLDDVKASRRELAKVIREVDASIAENFAAAYADVRENFIKLFSTLFPGGVGDLSLTDPDNPLETGIEIKAKPSGKNVRKLSLLSGGERSLVALAYLFAVFRSRSSPFYVMDEVEAALDDLNLHRFLDLVAEFRSQAQLIIVSHQKRTMEAADALFGVTMQPGGSSKVVSEKV